MHIYGESFCGTTVGLYVSIRECRIDLTERG